MTDVVLSPIPYYGGTLQMGYHLSHYADMGNGKLLNVVVQTNPAYLFAYVTNVTNLKTGTLSSANGPMRALLSPSAGGAREDVTTVRLYKINATTALLKYGNMTSGNGSISYHRVITILPNDDVTLSTITYAGGVTVLPSMQTNYKNSDYEYAQNYSTISGVGSYQNIWNAGDNILFVATRVAGQQFTLQRLVYDPSTKTMTASNIFSPTNANLVYARFNLQDIPNSTKKLFYVQGSSGAQSYQAATIIYAAIIEPSTGVASIAAFVSNAFQIANCTAMCALSETLVLGFATNTRYYSMSPVSSTAWGNATASTVFTQTGGTYHVAHAEALDTNYFALFSHQYSGNLTSDSLSLRIGRYVDKDYGQVSSATNNLEGINIGPGTNPYVDEKFINRASPDAFYIYGRSATNSYLPTIRVLYQAGG